MRLELCQSRIVGMSRPDQPCLFAPWLLAALRVRVAVPEWDHLEEGWVHWAAAIGSAGKPELPARRFDPSRRAAAAGEPHEAQRRGAVSVGEGEARAFVEAIMTAWRPEILHHRELGLVSRLDEGREPFRRRCLLLLRPLLQRKDLAGPVGPRELVALALAVESVHLGPEHIEVLDAQVGVTWHAAGVEPSAAGNDMMIAGGARGAR